MSEEHKKYIKAVPTPKKIAATVSRIILELLAARFGNLRKLFQGQRISIYPESLNSCLRYGRCELCNQHIVLPASERPGKMI